MLICDRYKLTGTWSFTITLEDPANGVLEPVVGDCNEKFLPKDFNVDLIETEKTCIDSTEASFKTFLTENLSASIKIINENLIQRFKTVGKFVYPGNGVLLFQNPIFNNVGNVLAEISYQPYVTLAYDLLFGAC